MYKEFCWIVAKDSKMIKIWELDFRFANQEKLRARKDALIQDMAMAQKKKTEEAKKTGRMLFNYIRFIPG